MAMTLQQIEIAERILGGVRYLIGEAERNRIYAIARILRSCARGIARLVEQDGRSQDEPRGR